MQMVIYFMADSLHRNYHPFVFDMLSVLSSIDLSLLILRAGQGEGRGGDSVHIYNTVLL